MSQHIISYNGEFPNWRLFLSNQLHPVNKTITPVQHLYRGIFVKRWANAGPMSEALAQHWLDRPTIGHCLTFDVVLRRYGESMPNAVRTEYEDNRKSIEELNTIELSWDFFLLLRWFFW